MKTEKEIKHRISYLEKLDKANLSGRCNPNISHLKSSIQQIKALRWVLNNE